ncbi:CHAT domain-containing tetratricopeptide repeat protein [Teichococcus aestuarii]|uniref:CHAT domain-containing protein n=1 Tax=Teichococcus aestuarii TaxID=568898 RepID=A0A2U1UY54_9PROT|nr:CHAT domain-containing protein [Pseudoroseomonas aestuarii]PWC26583.1 hypothetical protein CR165_22330 [Pseudoroseomonas aestuarii]
MASETGGPGNDQPEELEGLLQAFLATQTLEETQAFVAAHAAALLDGKAEAALRAAAVQEPGDSQRRAMFLWHADLLQDCHRKGIQAAFQPFIEAQRSRQLVRLAERMTQAPDWRWLAGLAEQAPQQLLEEGLLAGLLEAMIANLQAHRTVLAEAAERGWEAALAPHLAELPPAEPSRKQISAMVQHLNELAGADDPATAEKRITLARTLLDFPAIQALPKVVSGINLIRGNALHSLGQMRSEAGLLDDAVQAYRNALLEYTRERAPLDWAAIQSNLGIALQLLGEMRGEAELLIDAVQAYRNALLEHTRERALRDWADGQHNLGTALQSLGEMRGEAELLVDAVQAYRNALLGRTREHAPRDWAATQHNLGNALYSLGEMQNEAEMLADAVQAYRNALLEHTRERALRDWVTTQNNLGSALSKLGEMREEAGLLYDAAQAFHNLLLEYTREHDPQNWARIQNNLGNALRPLGQMRGEAELLADAVQAYRSALLEFTRERAPRDWATTQNNLGNALLQLGKMRGEAGLLADAVQAYSNALLERTRERAPRDWAATQHNLGNALSQLGEAQGEAGLLDNAVQAYRDALIEYTRERAPLDHIRTALAQAKALLTASRWAEAADILSPTLDLALDAVDDAATMAQQRQFLGAISGLGDLLAFACLRLGRHADAFDAAGRGRAVLLAAAQAADHLADDTTQAQSLRAARNAWRDACHAADMADAALATSSFLATADLAKLAARRHAATESVRQAWSDYQAARQAAGIKRPPYSSPAALAATIPPQGALALITLTRWHAAILLLRHREDAAMDQEPAIDVLELPGLDGPSVHALLFGRSDRQSDAVPAVSTTWFAGYADFARAIEQAGPIGVSAEVVVRWGKVIEDVLHALWQRLMCPLRDHLRAIGLSRGSEVVLCLPGHLAAIPLHTAGEPVADSPGLPGKWCSFLDDYAVSYVPSPQALLDARVRSAEPARQGASLLAVTNPTADPNIAVSANPAWAAFASGRRKELRHGAATAAALVAEIGPGGAGWNFLSLYCHGGFDPADPDGSGLEVASRTMADGQILPEVLSVRALRALELPAARLAFLSACESGRIGLQMADEHIGLPAALLEAGIPSVLASHWFVSARATQLLAEAFFRLLLRHDLSPAQALRLAQLGLRDAARAAQPGGPDSVFAMAEAMMRFGQPLPDEPEDQTSEEKDAPAQPPPPIDQRLAMPFYWAAFSLTGV